MSMSGGTRRSQLRLLLIGLGAVLILAVVVGVLTRGPGEEPFAGVYWDPSSGRRVEITVQDDRYELLYGVAKRAYRAERYGDELQVRDPFSGYILVRATDEGLVLVSGGREARLEPLPRDK